MFIVTYKDEHIQTYINVFNKGIIFNKEDIDNYLEQLQVNQNDIFYQPCSNRDLIRRCLRNLVVSFEKLSEHSKADEIKVLLQSVTSGLDTDV